MVQLLSRTAPENQFSVTPDGDVFAGNLLGYHYENERFYVTALSPILDDAADLLLARSGGAGVGCMCTGSGGLSSRLTAKRPWRS